MIPSSSCVVILALGWCSDDLAETDAGTAVRSLARSAAGAQLDQRLDHVPRNLVLVLVVGEAVAEVVEQQRVGERGVVFGRLFKTPTDAPCVGVPGGVGGVIRRFVFPPPPAVGEWGP